mmetsp:Transcript_14752/g.21654  ORF Transcript_14752/g.21654 Transcript_14752/m.21654 type:complete len:269 (-) Transcript_14752:479-1285(-)
MMHSIATIRFLFLFLFISTTKKSCSSIYGSNSAMMVTAFSTSTTSTRTQPQNTIRYRRRKPFVLNLSSEDKASMAQEEAAKLRELAARLRGEVSEFEQSKANAEKAVQAEQSKAQQEIVAKRKRYSAEVPILKSDGSTVLERVDFPPRLGNGKSFIQAVQAPLPLGLILGEDETIPGAIRVDDIAEEGNGYAAGVKVGDLVRACTACQVIMETPTWQLLAGGIGQPKTKRFMYGTDGRPFEEVMDALGSNRMDPSGDNVWLVIERDEE